MRRSFDGLMVEVRSVLALDPLSGHVVAFIYRRRNQVKLLIWTRGGFTIVHELSMLLEGIDVQRARISPRWEPPFDPRTAQR